MKRLNKTQRSTVKLALLMYIKHLDNCIAQYNHGRKWIYSDVDMMIKDCERDKKDTEEIIKTLEL